MAAAIGLLACAGGSRLERGDHPPAASTVGPAATVAASAPVPFPALSASGPVVDERGATSARAQSTAPEPSASGAVAAPSGRCPQDMVDVALACIDRYEAPNRAGEKPL